MTREHTMHTRNSHGAPTSQIGEHITHIQASQPCENRVAKFPRVHAFRVSRESYMCTAEVRCGRWDLGVTSVLLPSYYRVSQVGATWEEFPECGHVCCRVSLCGQELVRGEIQIFWYLIGGTWVFTVLLQCGGQSLQFSHVSHS